MISCATIINEETNPIVVYPVLDFPIYPEPKNNVVPLSSNGEIVTDYEDQIISVLMPFWYYKLIVEYKSRVDRVRIEYDYFMEQVKKNK